MGETARIGVAMGEARGGARMWHSPRILFVEGQDEREQGSRESSSTGSTFATRGEGGGAERRERMGVTARIEAAMGEVRVGASRRTQQLHERMKWLGDEAKRWLWRDAG